VTTASKLVTRANGLLNSLNLAEAELILQKAVALDPHCVEALVSLGRLALLNQRAKDALPLLNRALSIQPGHAEALTLKAVCSMQEHRFEFAVELLEQARGSEPDLAIIHFNLGKCYRELGQLSRAEESLCKAIERNPKHFAAHRELSCVQMQAGRVKDSLESMLCAIGMNRGKEYTDYLRLGSYAVALQEFEIAEKAFQASIGLNPASWEGHYNLGELYMSARLMDRARAQYQAALDKNSGSYEPFNGMGLFVLVVDRDCDRAIGLLKQAIEAEPTRPEARLNLALAYAKNRELQAAQTFAASVLTLSKRGDPAYNQAERLHSIIRIENRTLGSLK
jgi:tetratricopeptide (TPR) repeat protein